MDAIGPILLQRMRNAVMLRYLRNIIDRSAPSSPSLEDDDDSEGYTDSQLGAELEDLDPEDDAQALADQAMRDAAYICFPQEDEDDYTEGPARIANAFDGIKECGALLVTYDLSKKVQHMLEEENKYLAQKSKSERQTEAIRKFCEELDGQILRHKARVSVEAANAVGSQAGEEDLSHAQHELDMLELLKDSMRAKQQDIDVNLSYRADVFQEAQSDVNALIRDAFAFAGLFSDPPLELETPVDAYDLQVEYEKLCEQLEEMGGGPKSKRPLNTGDDFMRAGVSEPTEEQQAKNQIWNRLWLAKQRFREAQNRFDAKEEKQHKEMEQNKAAELNGEPTTDPTVEAFDHRWLLKNREMTRELIDAEIEFSKARADAAEAGVGENSVAQSSIFVSEPEDGTFISHEPVEPTLAQSNPRIRRWLVDVDESVMTDRQDVIDVDELVTDDIDISDSRSLVAYGSARCKIDGWQEACRLVFEQVAVS